MLEHILVPLDGSPLAEAAIHYIRHVCASRSQIYLLSVVQLPDTTFVPSVKSADKLDRILTDARHYLAEQAEQLTEAGYHVETRTHLGDAATIIVEIARQQPADIIMMSTHGYSGLRDRALGSVTQQVLNTAPCPVFIIPSREQPVPKLTGTKRIELTL
jgi:nucleotide-binding universal stress UspA family protein